MAEVGEVDDEEATKGWTIGPPGVAVIPPASVLGVV
jgi:hypothetical protein